VAVHQYVGGNDTIVKQFSPADLAQDSDIPNNTCYPKRFQGEPSGETNGSTCVSSALSMHGLLAASGLDVSDNQLHTAVVRNDGTWATLATAELQDPVAPGVFYGPSQLPAVYSTGNGVGYVRPLRSADDANQQDIFTPNDQSSPLNVYVFTGPTLTVKASASQRNKVKLGQSVRFSATVTGSSDPTSLQYSWSFGDGQTASAPSPSHAFTAAGTYSVLLKVVGSDEGSGGMSRPLTIKVGAPSKTASPSPGGGSHSPSPSPKPSPSASTPQPTPDPSSSPAAGGTAQPKLPGLGKLRLGRSIAARLGALLAGQQPLVAKGAAGSLPVVSGQLIGAGQPVSLSEAASESTVADATGSSLADQSTRWSPGVAPIYVGAVLLLLGIGVARERGWLTPRRR
jgi:PKD repeat protein